MVISCLYIISHQNSPLAGYYKVKCVKLYVHLSFVIYEKTFLIRISLKFNHLRVQLLKFNCLLYICAATTFKLLRKSPCRRRKERKEVV